LSHSRGSLQPAGAGASASGACEANGPVFERVGFIGAEVIADFPEGYTVDESCVSADGIEPEMLDFWVFLRAKE